MAGWQALVPQRAANRISNDALLAPQAMTLRVSGLERTASAEQRAPEQQLLGPLVARLWHGHGTRPNLLSNRVDSMQRC